MKLYAGQACNNLMLDLQNADMFSPAPDRLPPLADEPPTSRGPGATLRQKPDKIKR